MEKIKLFLLSIFITIAVSNLNSVVFKEIKSANFNLYYQRNLPEEKIKEIIKKIEFVYDEVSINLSYPLANPAFYIYEDNETLFDDIINKYNYNKSLKRYKSKPRMSRDYKVWITQDEDIKSIAYIYSLRIIEQMCSDNYATVPLWFDLGFGDYISMNVFSKVDAKKGERIKANLKNQIALCFKNNKYIPLSYLAVIKDWQEYGIGTRGGLNYKISTMIVYYLIEKYGMDKIKSMLTNIKYGLDFFSAFNKVYNFDTYSLEEDFKSYFAKFKLLPYDNYLVLYPKIYHLAGNEIFKEFYAKLSLAENGIYAKTFTAFVNDFEESDEFYGIKNNLAVFSYVLSAEDKFKLMNIIYKFIDLRILDINDKITEKTSFIYLEKREKNDPVILLGAFNDENMIKVYEYLKDKQTINEGYTLINHDK